MKSMTGERAFVGRGAELAAVGQSVRAAAGGTARVVWIEGDAGSGKTALARRIVADLPRDYQLVQAEADELAADEWLAVAAQLGPLTAASAFAAGLELLERFSRRQDDGPVAVLVEDLHWADAASRQALLTVGRRLDQDRVVLLVTSRPGSGAADGWERFSQDPDRCLRVQLGALAPAEVAELAARAGKRLAGPDAERLHRHTQGHPLYVRTLLNELSPQQLATTDGNLPAPRSLASATIARLAGLPADARALASALAVVNTRVPLGTAARVAGVPRPAPALESLLGTSLVRWMPSEAGTPVEYAHPLYRAAVYADLSPVRRQELHRMAAGVLQPGAALAHRVAAADVVDDELADELDAAAGAETGQGTADLAVRYLLWASPLSSRRDAAELRLLRAARLLLANGQTVRAAALRPQVTVCGDGPLRSLVLGMLAWQEGDASAEQWLSRVVTAADDAPGDPQVLAAALAELGLLYTTQGRSREAIESASRALAQDPASHRVEQASWQVLATGEAQLRGAPAGLTRLAERLPEAAGAVRPTDCDLLVTRGSIGFYAGRVSAAAADLRAVVRLARRGSVVVQLPRAHLHLADLLIQLGEWDEAQVHARVALSLVSDERRVWMQAQAHATLGGLLAWRGAWDAATEHVTAALDAAAALGTTEAVFKARIAQAALGRARHQPELVTAALRPLAGNGDVTRIPMYTSLAWWLPLIQAIIDSGDPGAAEQQLNELERAAGARGLNLRARITGLRARVAQASGRPDEAHGYFETAIALLGPDDPALDQAQLRHAFGRLLLARGDRRGAVEQLRPAHELLERLGAEPFRAPVQADLALCGVRPADQAAQSPMTLTDRERDVAVLVAKGMTNREVAAELYVSVKAVEYHLRHVFDKLGVTSRRALRGHQFD